MIGRAAAGCSLPDPDPPENDVERQHQAADRDGSAIRQGLSQRAIGIGDVGVPCTVHVAEEIGDE